MTIAFSALSLKRNRSSSTNSTKKESKLNAILNKITSPFHQIDTHSSHKKRKEQHNRRSSLSLFIDYFRTEDNTDHPFANDALFEQNRYRQQQKKQHSQFICNNNLYPTTNNNTNSILINKNSHHRHTNSTPSATTQRRKKSNHHSRHYSHVSCISSSNITVKSEDLTAKEFADIAGIRILSEDEIDDLVVDDSYITTSKKICTFCGDHEEDDDIMVPSLTVSRISHPVIKSSSISSMCSPEDDDDLLFDGLEPPQIWDNQFWKKPGHQLHEPTQEKKQEENSTTVIKKGRFEIHISSTSPHIKKHNHSESIEWKRKSITSSRPTTTLKHQLTA